MPSFLILACFLAFAGFVLAQVQSYRRLSHVPGPKLAAVSKAWMLKCLHRKDLHLQLRALSDKYGSVVRITPNDVITNDPEFLARMASVRSKYTRSDFYTGTQFDMELNHVFSETNEQRHLDLRRRLTPGYSGKENPALEQSITDRIQDLMSLISREYTSSGSDIRPMDFATVAQYFTLDVISDIAFGKPMGFLQKNEDINGYCAVVEKALPAFEWAAALPMINQLMRLPGVRSLVMPSPKDSSGVGMIMRFAKENVALRFGSEKIVKADMLQAFLRHGISQREAETEGALQIMAGSDTTVTALRATLLFIVTNPMVHRRLMDELKAAQEKGKLTLPVVRDEESREMPYLLACIRESLRLWPPSFGLLQKIVPAGGDHVQGVFLPEGTRVGHSTWSVLRSRSVFGADSDCYRPERWLEKAPGKMLEMTRSGDLLFGAGRYQCLGKSIAYLELRKCLATLFANYNMSIVDPTAPWKSAVANGMFLQSDMMLRIEEKVHPIEK